MTKSKIWWRKLIGVKKQLLSWSGSLEEWLEQVLSVCQAAQIPVVQNLSNFAFVIEKSNITQLDTTWRLFHKPCSKYCFIGHKAWQLYNSYILLYTVFLYYSGESR